MVSLGFASKKPHKFCHPKNISTKGSTVVIGLKYIWLKGMWKKNISVVLKSIWTPERYKMVWLRFQGIYILSNQNIWLQDISTPNFLTTVKVRLSRNDFFLAEDSPKKRTKTRRILVKTNSFVRFLGESSAWLFLFEINWPLT